MNASKAPEAAEQQRGGAWEVIERSWVLSWAAANLLCVSGLWLSYATRVPTSLWGVLKH